jgi:hypothetical protein
VSAFADAECASCPFWQADGNRRTAEHGACRRHAPRPGADDWSWPRTDSDDVCGEHPALRDAPAGVWHDELELYVWPHEDAERMLALRMTRGGT